MGLYLFLYIIALIVSLIFYYLFKHNKKEFFYNLSIFFILLMIFFFVLSLTTNDPIEEIITAIPAFWQFMITALSGSFAIYKVYLNPLKERVITTEKDISSIKTDIGNTKENINEMKPYIMKKVK